MKNYKLILGTVLMGALFSCTNPEHYDTPDLSSECGDLTANKTVADITAATTTTLKKYATDDIIEAYVTSSDEGGNFYKSISFVSADNAFGFSVPIDDYNLYTKYEPGRKVYVNMKNLYHVKDMGGSVSGTVIGSVYNNNTIIDDSDDEVGRMSIAEYQSVLTASCNGYKSQEDLAIPMTITDAKSEANLNKLIVLNGVQFSDLSLGKMYFDPSLNSSNFATATDHTIKDNNDVSLIVRVSSFSTFASQTIPSGNGKMYGVMTKFNNTYQFMLRTINDVQLTGPRTMPPPAIFDESFPSAANFSSWIKYSASGAQQWAWEGSSYAAMNGYQGGAVANEDWLITPVQNLSSYTNATLTFETATNFSGNAITVMISRNFAGGTANPNTATWVPLTATLAPTNSNYAWTPSGNVNISAYTGTGNNTVYIAFKYTSTTSAAAKWEVDKVRIMAN